jgi:hypothetical protein
LLIHQLWFTAMKNQQMVSFWPSLLNTCGRGADRSYRKVMIFISYTARLTGTMSAIEISVTPACCSGGGGGWNKGRVYGKMANHLNVHSWFIVSIATDVILIMQQGVLLYRLNTSNERFYWQVSSTVQFNSSFMSPIFLSNGCLFYYILTISDYIGSMTKINVT